MPTGRILRPRTQEGFDLLVPGRKPSSRLLAPIYNNAQYINLFESSTGILGEPGAVDENAIITDGVLKQNSSSTQPDLTFGNTATNKYFPRTGAFTYAIKTRMWALTSFYFPFKNGIGTNHISIKLTRSGTVYRVEFIGVSSVNTAYIYEAHKWIDIVMSRNSGGDYYYSINGIAVSSGVSTLDIYNRQTQLHTLGGGGASGGNYGGEVSFMYIGHHFTPFEDVRDKGVFCALLKPANSTPFLYSTGTPSTVTLSNLTFGARTATSITPRLDVTVS